MSYVVETIANFLRDVRWTLRRLLQAPIYSASVILTLALAIGANSAIFGAMSAVLLQPLKAADPERLIVAWETDAARRDTVELSYRSFEDWDTRNQSFESLAAMGSSLWTRVLDGYGSPVRLQFAGVSSSFFRTLGVQPLIGRDFTPEDDAPNAPKVLVLSHATWTQRFGGTPTIIGAQLRLNDQRYTVVGVMPPDVAYPRGAEFWSPVVPVLAASSTEWNTDALRKVGVLIVVGRLKPGVSAVAARSELDALSTHMPDRATTPRFGASVVVTPLVEHILGPVQPALWALFAATCVLLLIACANVMGLMLSRIVNRDREHAVRIALGASGHDLRRLWSLEVAVLAVAGGGLGLMVASGAMSVIGRAAPPTLPRIADLQLNETVAVFTMVATLVVALFCGWGVLRQASRGDVAETLKAGAYNARTVQSQRTQSRLLVLQVAMAVVLMVMAGLSLRSFAALQQVDLGFQPDRVLTMTVAPRDPANSNNRWFDELLARVRVLPGVTDAGTVYLRPLLHGHIDQGAPVVLEGQPETPRSADLNPKLSYQVASVGYFNTLGIALKQGRLFSPQDVKGVPRVAIVSERTARALWPGQDAVGRRVLMPTFERTGPFAAWRTVVGVVSDVRYRGLNEDDLEIYDPALQAETMAGDLTIRTSGDPLLLVSAVQAEVAHLSSRAVIDRVATMEAIVARERAPWEFAVWLFAMFAVIAFVLSVAGLGSLVTLDVGRRGREFAVRLALGASRRDIVGRVLGAAASRVATGAVAGVLVSVAMAQWIQSILFGVAALDPLTYLTVLLLVAVTVVATGAWPAWRAAAIDSLVLLRRDAN